MRMQTAYHFSGNSLSNACIAMAGARDRALIAMFFDDPSNGDDIALLETKAMANAALREAQDVLWEVCAHGHDSQAIAKCRSLVEEATGCVQQASQAQGRAPNGLRSHIWRITAAVRAEAGMIERASCVLQPHLRKPTEKRPSYASTHPDAPEVALTTVKLTDELIQMFHPEQPEPEESRVRNTLQRLSKAAHDLAEATRDAAYRLAESVRLAAREAVHSVNYYGHKCVRISKRAIKRALAYWRDLRDAAVDSYHRLGEYFYGTSEVPETILPMISPPLPTLSVSNARLLEGVISTLRPFAIDDVITVHAGCRITASEIVGIAAATKGDLLILPCGP